MIMSITLCITLPPALEARTLIKTYTHEITSDLPYDALGECVAESIKEFRTDFDLSALHPSLLNHLVTVITFRES